MRFLVYIYDAIIVDFKDPIQHRHRVPQPDLVFIGVLKFQKKIARLNFFENIVHATKMGVALCSVSCM